MALNLLRHHIIKELKLLSTVACCIEDMKVTDG